MDHDLGYFDDDTVASSRLKIRLRRTCTYGPSMKCYPCARMDR